MKIAISARAHGPWPTSVATSDQSDGRSRSRAALYGETGVVMKKCTMTLNISEREMDVLTCLAERKGMTKTALMRQALRLYQAVDAKQEKGERLLFESNLSKLKVELLVI